MKNVFFTLSAVALFLHACKKKSPDEQLSLTSGALTINVLHKIDSLALCNGQFNYVNDAGNIYSITRLMYYLSDLNLIKEDSSVIEIKDFKYLDAFSVSNNSIVVSSPPPGNYIGLKFNIGLDSIKNQSGYLPITNESINMQWPDMMGGGYHFLKLEGYFKDTVGNNFGYAMHIGKNKCLIPIIIYHPIQLDKNSNQQITLVMNINEWYRNPTVFNFNVDGNYTMGNDTLMKKIANNGRDVFSWP